MKLFYIYIIYIIYNMNIIRIYIMNVPKIKKAPPNKLDSNGLKFILLKSLCFKSVSKDGRN